MYAFYEGLDGHWYLRGVFGYLIWRSPWRKPLPQGLAVRP